MTLRAYSNQLCLAFLLTLILNTSVLSQSKLSDEVLEFERLRVNATLQADVKALESMLAIDLVWAHASGKVDSKVSYIQNLAEKKARYKSMFIEESAARIYGNNVITNGILNFESISPDETIAANRVRFTCVYRKVEKKWQVISWHATSLK